MLLLRKVGRRLKLAIFGLPSPQLDPRIFALEQVFRSPPLTRSLASAIHLISPHCDFRPNERNRRIWEADENGACWAEFELVRDELAALPKRARILEIGPGLGRSLIFFSKKLGWENCELHAYEGDGKSTKYTANGPRFENSWCGTISELRKVLNYNDIHNVMIHDAGKIAMTHLPGPFDLVFGFYNIGYHWSLEHFMPEVLALIGSYGIAIFTVPHDFEPFEALAGLPYKVTKDLTTPLGERLRLLILGPIHAQREKKAEARARSGGKDAFQLPRE
jgi:16S rRNA A1518/A1519 N6-dimethyltransferase RsmA/KsgA/DIM1 with predicted DNA glycosylase/AP lyase activity